MHLILLFMGVMAAWGALATALFAFGIWVVTIDDPRLKPFGSNWLSAMFWPFLPLFSWIESKFRISRGQRPAVLAKTREVGTDPEAQRMKRFGTVREAKDYLAGRITKEAELEGAKLTEVERKMLYFTETGWTLPDMKEVSAEFDRGYNQEEYERKIARLVSKIQANDETQNEQEQEAWDWAVEKLSHGDHYILVLIHAAEPQRNLARHWLKVLAAALGLFAFAALDIWFRQWMREH